MTWLQRQICRVLGHRWGEVVHVNDADMQLDYEQCRCRRCDWTELWCGGEEPEWLR